jgi:hypothetical protein
VITNEWQPEFRLHWYVETQTKPVVVEGIEYVADVHRSVLTASQGGKPLWQFAAGGRIQQRPAVLGDRLLVGSADGWATCLDRTTGKPLWRFLGAPTERMIVAYGQLENASPVYGVAAHDGRFYISAGRHAEVDGGIYIWGLDPATGAARYSTRLYTAPVKAQIGESTPKKVPAFDRSAVSQTPINGGLEVVEGKLCLRNAVLNKSGSSVSKWGYFKTKASTGGSSGVADRSNPNFKFLEIQPAWNDQTIDPQPLYVEVKKKK